MGKKEIFTYTLTLLIGIAIGSIGIYLYSSQELKHPDNQDFLQQKEEIKHKTIWDTVEVKKIIPVYKEIQNPIINIQSNNNNDSDYQEDTLNEKSTPQTINLTDSDSLEKYSETDIISERLVAKRIITIKHSYSDSNTVEALLDIKRESFADKILVEYWYSPLHITGYQLFRNKLKLYGFNSNESIHLTKEKADGDQLLLITPSIKLHLTKSIKFRSIKLK